MQTHAQASFAGRNTQHPFEKYIDWRNQNLMAIFKCSGSCQSHSLPWVVEQLSILKTKKIQTIFLQSCTEKNIFKDK